MNTLGLFQIIEKIDYANNAAVCDAPERLIIDFQKSKDVYLYELVKILKDECEKVINGYEKELNTAS